MHLDVMPDIEQALCRVLTGVQEPRDLSATRLDQLWAEATFTGGAELLARMLTATDHQVNGPARDRAVACLRDAAVTEILRRRVLRRIVDSFEAAGTRMLLIKGAGLAYTAYPQPYLRPANDIDLFINRESLDGAEAALALAGFARMLEPNAESASMQRHYLFRDGYGVEHFVDLHWRIVNRHAFAHAISFEDAWDASRPVAALGRVARTLSTYDALLLACVHRIAHHDDDPDRLWLWDIHLLVGNMTRADMDGLAARLATSGMRAVVARGLDLAQQMFGTDVHPWLLAELQRTDGSRSSPRYGWRKMREVDHLISDLAAIGSLRARIDLLREHLFPDFRYMRGKYPACPAALLPFAYVYRIAGGAPRWFRPRHEQEGTG